MNYSYIYIYNSHYPLPEIEEGRGILKLSPEKLMRRQLMVAIERKDTKKITSITIKLKNDFFRNVENAEERFALDQFPNLKRKNAFCKRHGIKVEELKDGMLRWTKTPIHTSLTVLENPLARKTATKMFKNVMVN